MSRLSLLLIAGLMCQLLFSKQRVDTVAVFSNKMRKEVKSVVILPDKYSKKKSYPVVYLLHGYSDDYSKWVKTVPTIKNLASLHNLIIVCPDGGYSSWYFDSPIDSAFQYESYITRDLIAYIDKNYATQANRNGRAITGQSMGGHGALYLAIRNKNLFSQAGSMSGGVDLRTSTRKYDIANRIGSIESNASEWDNRSVVNMVTELTNKDLNLIVDCGVSDFFYQINAALHRRLVALNIHHDYIERPGSHNWDYWTNAINYQLQFFALGFESRNRK